jgi:sugar phosphate isomerase/epimerase
MLYKMASNKLAISSISISQYPGHLLDHRIRAAAAGGFAGIEIVYNDLATYGQAQNIPIQTAAQKIRSLCQTLDLKVLSLAPFENYEGASSPLSQRLALAQHWMDIARILEAPYLQVPSIFASDCSRDETIIVSDLQRLADLGASAKPTISIAYEALSWGVNCSTWESALDLVNRVDRPNFGLCMDTFHEGTRIWGDNASPNGKQMDADLRLRESLARFVRDCPVEKIFYVQLSDAERFDPPYSAEHPWAVVGEAKEFTWSRHARPFPLERELGGYLPVAQIARAWIVEKGFRGWVSMEVFDRAMRDGSVTPEAAARRGVESWKKLQVEMGDRSRL